MDELTGARIVLLRNHIADVLNQTSEGSILPPKQQAEMLAECCGQACGLLGEWLRGPERDALRPAGDMSVKEMIKDRAAFDQGGVSPAVDRREVRFHGRGRRDG